MNPSLSESVRLYGIPYVREITTTIAAGPTLETKPNILSALKQKGITTVVDFRGGAQPLIENVCNQTGLNYFQIDFNHAISSGKNAIPAPKNFAEQLRQFFRIMDKGHAYIGCQYGVHRTNAALLFNYILNNSGERKYNIPTMLRLDSDGNINNIINILVRKAWKVIKAMTPSEKTSFGISGTESEIFRKFIYKTAGEIKRHAKNFI